METSKERDPTSADRDENSDARDETADNRDRTADNRDRTADNRDRTADNRDRRAEDRDRSAEDRDRLAEKRDRLVGAPGASPDAYPEGEERRDLRAGRRSTDLSAAVDRASAASDRASAASDREAASGSRQRGASDRTRASDDRSAASVDRVASAMDREASSIDDLTGVHRRGAGLVELEREMMRAKRTRQPFVLAFVDVDGLKATNDSLGHAAGDELLRGIADSLRAHLRPYDLVIRFGGDEFVCALTDLSLDEADKRFSLVDKNLRATRHGSITVGLAKLEQDDSLVELIARADQALYEKRRTLG